MQGDLGRRDLVVGRFSREIWAEAMEIQQKSLINPRGDTWPGKCNIVGPRANIGPIKE